MSHSYKCQNISSLWTSLDIPIAIIKKYVLEFIIQAQGCPTNLGLCQRNAANEKDQEETDLDKCCSHILTFPYYLDGRSHIGREALLCRQVSSEWWTLTIRAGSKAKRDKQTHAGEQMSGQIGGRERGHHTVVTPQSGCETKSVAVFVVGQLILEFCFSLICCPYIALPFTILEDQDAIWVQIQASIYVGSIKHGEFREASQNQHFQFKKKSFESSKLCFSFGFTSGDQIVHFPLKSFNPNISPKYSIKISDRLCNHWEVQMLQM